MRVLFTSNSGLGHVHPMVPMAFAMRDRGHEMRWLTGPDAIERLQAVGIRDGCRRDVVRGAARRVSDGGIRRRRPSPVRICQRTCSRACSAKSRQSSSCRRRCGSPREWRPDLVIHDAAEFAGPIAAALIGAPAVTYAFGALTPIERVQAAAERAAPLWRSVGLEPRPFGGLYDTLYLDIYPPSLQRGRHDPRPAPPTRAVRRIRRPGGWSLEPGPDRVPQRAPDTKGTRTRWST